MFRTLENKCSQLTMLRVNPGVQGRKVQCAPDLLMIRVIGILHGVRRDASRAAYVGVLLAWTVEVST